MPLAFTSSSATAGSRGTDYVPLVYRPALQRSAQRWNVSSALLAAQIQVESGFNPAARSPVGALGISQFMPATARSYGLSNRLNPAASIDAQAHMMRDLLRSFASVPLALAAYNAGPGAVRRCGCIPPYAETRQYVARILAVMGGKGSDRIGVGADVPVRLVG
jgi:soluble lytic murein transglycosylase-like protein